MSNWSDMIATTTVDAEKTTTAKQTEAPQFDFYKEKYGESDYVLMFWNPNHPLEQWMIKDLLESIDARARGIRVGKTGKCYADFENEETLERVKKLDGETVGDIIITVSAVPKRSDPPKGNFNTKANAQQQQHQQKDGDKKRNFNQGTNHRDNDGKQQQGRMNNHDNNGYQRRQNNSYGNQNQNDRYGNNGQQRRQNNSYGNQGNTQYRNRNYQQKDTKKVEELTTEKEVKPQVLNEGPKELTTLHEVKPQQQPIELKKEVVALNDDDDTKPQRGRGGYNQGYRQQQHQGNSENRQGSYQQSNNQHNGQQRRGSYQNQNQNRGQYTRGTTRGGYHNQNQHPVEQKEKKDVIELTNEVKELKEVKEKKEVKEVKPVPEDQKEASFTSTRRFGDVRGRGTNKSYRGRGGKMPMNNPAQGKKWNDDDIPVFGGHQTEASNISINIERRKESESESSDDGEWIEAKSKGQEKKKKKAKKVGK